MILAPTFFFGRGSGLLLVLLSSLFVLSRAELIYSYNGVEERIPLTQLWFEGHWAALPPMNGTITWKKDGDVRGKIVMSVTAPPLESLVRELQHKGALAVLLVRPGTFQPGFAMYIVTGEDRSDLSVPVMEATYDRAKHVLKLPEGAFVQCIPTENLHKKARDTKFQLIMNLILSFWEIAIVAIACHRLYQFYYIAHSPLFSIAPLCCFLEAIAAALRLACTCVDPFYTYRMMNLNASNILITVSWPFSESAGILLTFFWAESLNKSNIKALPFISRYKWASISVVVIVFAVEIVCNILRVVYPLSTVPIYLSSVLMFLITVTLVTCYISAAVAIARRIGHRGKVLIRRMTMRIVISSAGYFIVIGAVVAFAIGYQHVWGRPMCLNAVFLGVNLAGLLQVLALKPIGISKTRPARSSSRVSTSSKPTDSTAPGDSAVDA